MLQLLQFLLLGVCCGTISYTITKGSIFTPLREWVIDRSLWLGKLITCPYCTSHWVSFVAMLVFHPRLINYGFAPTDYLATGFALVGLSAMSAGLIFKLFFVREE